MHPSETVINDYVDDALESPERADERRALVAHLDGCESCRRLVEDLRGIRRVAGSLDLREPPVRVWSRIERAIALEPRAADAQGAARPKGWRGGGARFYLMGLASVAVVALATVVGVRYRMTTRSATETADTVVRASADDAMSVEAELREAESHYDKAIKGLEQITKAEQGTFDSATAATLQKNLAVIDQAINESRAAVVAQPASEPARESLMDNFKAKLGLLQDTVALINEMRKGNEAGTARIVSGLNKKG
jgi:hypothetical protein